MAVLQYKEFYPVFSRSHSIQQARSQSYINKKKTQHCYVFLVY